MELIVLFLTAILGVFLFDLTLYGFLPPKLGLLPRISDLGDDARLIDEFCRLKTSLEGRVFELCINHRPCYMSVVLTTNHFFVRLNRLNYLFKIDVTDMKNFSVKKGFLGSHLQIVFNTNDTEHYINIYTSSRSQKDWIKYLKVVGVSSID